MNGPVYKQQLKIGIHMHAYSFRNMWRRSVTKMTTFMSWVELVWDAMLNVLEQCINIILLQLGGKDCANLWIRSNK